MLPYSASAAAPAVDDVSWGAPKYHSGAPGSTVSARPRITPIVAVIAALAAGCGLVVWAYALARGSTSTTHFAVFWVGYLTCLVTTAVAGLWPSTSPRLRTTLLATFGVISFVPKFTMSVNHAVYYDEFGHWRHVNDMLATGHVTPPNSFLPIVQYFPGLGVLTVGVHEVTRLSTWHSGQLIVLVAHCASLLLVAALGSEVVGSRRAGFLAAVVFSLNPSFLYFDTQYGYESLALPLALAAILAVLHARRAQTRRAAWQWAAVGMVAAFSCVLTHHVSSIIMAGTVLLVAALAPPMASDPAVRRTARLASWIAAVAGAGGTVFWVKVVARGTAAYLDPHLSSAFGQLLPALGIGRAAGDEPTTHTPFAGSGAPSYERLAAFVSPVLVLAAVAFGSYAIWLARRERSGAIRTSAPFALLAVLYFVSLPFTLTAAGGELAHRSWPFCFAGVGIIVAQAAPAARQRLARFPDRVVVPLALAALMVACVGGVAAGQNVDYRFPGPFELGSDTRGITAETLDTVRWADANVPAGTGVITDRTTSEALTGYTDLRVPDPKQSAVFAIYREGGQLSPEVRAELRSWGFDYFILDRRLLTQKPANDPYPEFQPGGIDAAALNAIAGSGLATLVHSSADYDVYRLNP